MLSDFGVYIAGSLRDDLTPQVVSFAVMPYTFFLPDR